MFMPVQAGGMAGNGKEQCSVSPIYAFIPVQHGNTAGLESCHIAKFFMACICSVGTGYPSTRPSSELQILAAKEPCSYHNK